MDGLTELTLRRLAKSTTATASENPPIANTLAIREA
jgi:hypothetical protein